MFLAILGFVLFILFIGGMGFSMWYVLKKTDPMRVDTSIGTKIETAQEFLPFSDIVNNMLDLGGHQYRMYIEVSSMNYFLRTEEEKKLVNLSFQRFINSLSYPITIFVQTRVANNEELLENLRQDYLRTADGYPALREYAEENFSEMVMLYQNRGTDREKRKYIIVSFDDAASMMELDDEAKTKFAYEELSQRCRILIDGLAGIGLNSKILSTTEIAELLLSTYHKRNYSHFKGLIGGEYTPLIVDGKNHMASASSDEIIDFILWEAENKLNQEILELTEDEKVRKKAHRVIQDLEKARKTFAGTYKSKQTKKM